MKRITYLILLLLIIGSCKFADSPYSFEREFEGGTYITPKGIVKYLSGAPDSAINISDNYAVVRERITYHKQGGNYNGTDIHLDSILVYGHCFSLEPNATALKDEIVNMETLNDLNDNVVIYYTGSGEPTDYISITELGAGTTFESSLGLEYEKDYYIRSFVITGRINGGDVDYKDIAYNQYELEIHTKTPVDLWVGGIMPNSPPSYGDINYKGATSFSYDGKMYVAAGHDEGDLDPSLTLYQFDPITNEWSTPFSEYTFPIDNQNFTNSVAFVIEDVREQDNQLHDYVYIGTGWRKNIVPDPYPTFTRLFLRYDLKKDVWVNMTTTFDAQEFIGNARDNAVGFSINGIGYVGLGNLSNGTVQRDFFKFDPTDRGPGNSLGKWTKIGDFDIDLTKACSFKIGNNVYVCCGEDGGGIYQNRMWMARQTSDDGLSWVEKAPFLGSARIDAVGMTIGENGYVGTGWDGNGGDSARSDYYRYDPRLNVWLQRAYYGAGGITEAIGEGVRISDSDYRGYLGIGWGGPVSTEYKSDFWHYRP